jgi:hypothetical protein
MLSSLRVYFLRIRDWQLFPLILVAFVIGIPQCFTIYSSRHWILVAALFASASTWPLLAWCWSIGTFFNSGVKPEFQSPTGFFHFSVIFSALYFGLVLVADLKFPPWLWPLHVVSMLSNLYTIYFVSKALALVRSTNTRSVNNQSVLFLLLLFFPIGIWFVQPMVNRLYAETRGVSP